ncbi:hypothetical protein chiPu_0015060 [Chiloscyllium punctatum]|uniref:Uncharacterized protein n=1 Tax=Chiloscyllium punctatum TaxID=137246 RepID=A0A401T1P6_CHIPU|nr:hypothetical protein [Chiloscyllium punctatum]
MEAEGMTLLVDTRKDPAVLSLNHEMTKDFNLQTMLNSGSDAYKLKTATKESFAYDGVSAKGDTTSPHSKGTQQNISMLKMGLRNQEGTLGPNTMKHDEMNNLRKMLGQIKTYPPRFPERRLYHLPSHFIGDNDSVLQHSPSPGERLMTALARDQIKDNNFSSPLHKTVMRPIRPPPMYNIFPADRHVLQNSAAYSIGRRLQGTWKRTGSTPGPCAYDVDRASSFIKHCRPSYTIRGTRREKRHDLGPFTTF